MLNHLIHFTKSFGLQQRALSLWDFPGARALTPPHSTSARGNDNLHYHYHDLVAISMGKGGWIFRTEPMVNHSLARVLEPKCHVCGMLLQMSCLHYHCVSCLWHQYGVIHLEYQFRHQPNMDPLPQDK